MHTEAKTDREYTAHMHQALGRAFPGTTFRIAALRHALAAPIAITWQDGPPTTAVLDEACYRKRYGDHVFILDPVFASVTPPWHGEYDKCNRRVYLVRTFSTVCMTELVNRCCKRFQVSGFEAIELPDLLGAWWRFVGDGPADPMVLNQAALSLSECTRSEDLRGIKGATLLAG